MSFHVGFQPQEEFNVLMESAEPFKAGFNGISFEIGQDYNNLRNKPTLNGRTIQGDMQEADPTVPDWAKAPVKPVYSADEVGAIPTGAKLDAADLEYMWDTTEI